MDKQNTLQKLNIASVFNSHQSQTSSVQPRKIDQKQVLEKFMNALNQPIIDEVQLANLAWSGIPQAVRMDVWQILLKYLSTNKEAQPQIIAYKRKQYKEMVDQYFLDSDLLDSTEKLILQKIVEDVRGINLPILKSQKMQISLVRILFIWSIRHPQISYFKNLCSLIHPFITTFLDPEGQLPSQEKLSQIEADIYWCFTLFLDPMKKYFLVEDGEGCLQMAQKIKNIIKQIDAPLYAHWYKEQFDLGSICQRWVQYLLINLFPDTLKSRYFDTLISDGQGCQMLYILLDYPTLLLFLICAIFLKISAQMQTLNKLQMYKILIDEPPMKNWQEKDLQIILAEAFSYKQIYNQK